MLAGYELETEKMVNAVLERALPRIQEAIQEGVREVAEEKRLDIFERDDLAATAIQYLVGFLYRCSPAEEGCVTIHQMTRPYYCAWSDFEGDRTIEDGRDLLGSHASSIPVPTTLEKGM